MGNQTTCHHKVRLIARCELLLICFFYDTLSMFLGSFDSAPVSYQSTSVHSSFSWSFLFVNSSMASTCCEDKSPNLSSKLPLAFLPKNSRPGISKRCRQTPRSALPHMSPRTDQFPSSRASAPTEYLALSSAPAQKLLLFLFHCTKKDLQPWLILGDPIVQTSFPVVWSLEKQPQRRAV